MCFFVCLYVHGYAKGMQMHACTNVHMFKHVDASKWYTLGPQNVGDEPQ